MARLTDPLPLLQRIARLVAPRRESTDRPRGFGWIVAAEAIALPLVFFAASRLVRPDDPLWIDSSFPWSWLVPLVLALRYGTVAGLGASGVIVALWLGLEGNLGAPQPGATVPGGAASFPEAFFLGGLILVLLAGQFADVWNARLRRARSINSYLDERLSTLTKNHYLLRLSHERLEQDLLTRPTTLRDTLVDLRALAMLPVGGDTLPGARGFLQLLAQTCQLEVAAVYADRGGALNPQAAATLGTASPLDAQDPLLRYALEVDDLVHVQTLGDEGFVDAGRYLVCLPLLDSTHARIGVLTVERLPFFALDQEMLQLLTVIGGYYADGVSAGRIARAVVATLPDCPEEFALELTRLTRIAREVQLRSALVALQFERQPDLHDLFDMVRRQRRQIDLVWEIHRPTDSALVTLLPLAGAAGVEGYLARIEGALQLQFGRSFSHARIGTHTALLGDADAATTLTDLIRRLDVPAA